MPLLTSGAKLGPYEILEQLGAGGMGEVWKARDPRLNRFVAIKVSKDDFNERFAREAEVIAALNHPYICTLYDVGPNYLVMEFVDGKPLSGPMPAAEATRTAAQIASALDNAHRSGIIHRDLKPANILVTRNGVKVLDFGLAKFQPKPVAVADDQATRTIGLTQAGTIMGTLQYMSPEQVEGKEADARSDIFSFGAVLYEILTGKRAFEGASAASILASVMKEQPRPLRELDPLIPPPLQRVVQTCLEKDPEKRWQSAREMEHALEWIQDQQPPSPPAPVVRPRGKWLWPAISGVLALLLAFTTWVLWPKPPAPARAIRFHVMLPDNVEPGQYVSISPDGRKLVFNANGAQGGFWIQDLDTLEWRKLSGTEGGRAPFWSPDSHFLGFGSGNELKKVEIAGGGPQTLCSIPEQVGSGAWSRDGVIVFGTFGGGPLRRVSAAGGVPTDLTILEAQRGERQHALPAFLPDGKHFLYFRGTASPGESGIYAGSLDAKPADQSHERILASEFGAPFLDGNLFFVRNGTLMLQPFDAGKLQLRGEPVPVVEHVATTGRIGVFSVSNTGALAYRKAADVTGFQPTWFDRQGRATGTFAEPRPYPGLVLSPDATRAAGRESAIGESGDIWLLDFGRGVRSRVTFRQSPGWGPVWSADGRRIVFSAPSGGNLDTLYEKDASGAGSEKELLKTPGVNLLPSDWSRDGRFLMYTTANTPTGNDLWVLPLEGDRKPVLLLGTEFGEALARFSPDGRWVAYQSNESGRVEVYVRPFVASGSSGPSFGEGKWQVSKDGGSVPEWRNDGREIVFRARNGSPVAVDVTASGAALQMGVATQLFSAPGNGGWDMTADGKRFLMLVSPVQQTTQTPITVVLNWAADLKH